MSLTSQAVNCGVNWKRSLQQCSGWSLVRVAFPPKVMEISTTPEELCSLLVEAVRYGARAPELEKHVPDLVEKLCPHTRSAGRTVGERAIDAENQIKQAAGDLDDENLAGCVLALLALVPGTYRKGIGERCEIAGRFLGVGPSTTTPKEFRRQVLKHLAAALYRRLQGREYM